MLRAGDAEPDRCAGPAAPGKLPKTLEFAAASTVTHLCCDSLLRSYLYLVVDMCWQSLGRRVFPMLQALCICPTRELVIQNYHVLSRMAKYTSISAMTTASGSSEGARQGPHRRRFFWELSMYLEAFVQAAAD